MYATLADAICDHIGCLGMAQRLPKLARALNVATDVVMPAPPRSPHVVDLPAQGLRLVLRHEGQDAQTSDDPDLWVITDAQFRAPWGCGVPFELNVQTETPDWAAHKLGGETQPCTAKALAQGDRRQSYFLDDARVVEIVWKPRLIGIERIGVARLGRALDQPPLPPA